VRRTMEGWGLWVWRPIRWRGCSPSRWVRRRVLRTTKY
jgi:hypothetical protein